MIFYYFNISVYSVSFLASGLPQCEEVGEDLALRHSQTILFTVFFAFPSCRSHFYEFHFQSL